MVFSSLLFLFIFLPIFLGVYFLAPKGVKNGMLLIFSLIFYGWGEPIYIVLMIFSTVFDFYNGIIIDKYRHRRKLVKTIFIGSLIINFGMLGVFKYSGFIVDSVNNFLGTSIDFQGLPLPIGISFYTFQTLSYVIDVYLDKVKVQRNIISFGAYISMFPQLIAGPIVRYASVENQMDNRKTTLDDFSEGVYRFLGGLFKKVIIANNIGLLWATVKASEFSNMSMLTAWLGIIAFTLQIYFDFSGYSDMAIGLGKMIGFHFPENFNYPYISKSITEFWRRWHISLGTWFREYVYIPMGGNKVKVSRHIFNLLTVWMLTGLWHGAAWNFVFWGLYFGVILIVEKFIIKDILVRLPSSIQHIYALLLVLIGFVIFEIDSLTGIKEYVGAMFINTNFIDSVGLYYLTSYGVVILIGCILATPLVKIIAQKIKDSKVNIIIPIVQLALFIVCICYLVNDTYNPFLYFRF
ncbi:MAG: MBOAT family O-acyltransferase [Clostridium sp.]